MRHAVSLLPYTATVVNSPESLFVPKSRVITIHVKRDVPGMYVCMYVCACMYVCIYMYVCMYVCSA